MGKSVVVIGGGVIGLCSAYFLQNEGCQVTVVDSSTMTSGASYVNAGYVCPSHFIPLAAPGVVKQGLKWMFDATSPLYIKPRIQSDFLKWLWAFNKSCSSSKVQQNSVHLRDFCLFSQNLFQEFNRNNEVDFSYEKKGLLMLCQTEHYLKKELKVLKRAKDLGISAKEISPSDLRLMEPNVEIDALGGIYFPDDHHATPSLFMESMKVFLRSKGVLIFNQEQVIDIRSKYQRVESIITNQRSIHADAFVLAAGSWSAELLKKIDIKLLLQAGKGYAINSKQTKEINYPAILVEAKTAVTPMHGFTRFAGTMEIAGRSSSINIKRVESIARAVGRYYPSVKPSSTELETASYGFRPLSPDGLPYIGKVSNYDNLILATGHAMIGWTLGPGTGKLVSELVMGHSTSLDLSMYHPSRKF